LATILAAESRPQKKRHLLKIAPLGFVGRFCWALCLVLIGFGAVFGGDLSVATVEKESETQNFKKHIACSRVFSSFSAGVGCLGGGF